MLFPSKIGFFVTRHLEYVRCNIAAMKTNHILLSILLTIFFSCSDNSSEEVVTFERD
ncbi:uncharacterized protein METZ01_LOCUS446666, partial [marine metagenome]